MAVVLAYKGRHFIQNGLGDVGGKAELDSFQKHFDVRKSLNIQALLSNSIQDK